MQEGEDEEDIKQSCSRGDRAAYTLLYTFYFKPLYRHVFLFLKSKEETEEIVQNPVVLTKREQTLIDRLSTYFSTIDV